MELRGLAWWGPDHLVLHDAQGWQVRSWPAGTLVAAGGGLAIPHPDGRRWTVATGDGVEVDGVLHRLPGAVRARSGCWWRDGVCVARTDPRGGQSLSELWWVSAEGGPVRLAAGLPGHRFHSVTTLNDCLLTELYRHGNAQSVHQVRILRINGPGDAVDAVPSMDGSIHQLLMTPGGSRVVLWSADPNFTQHILVEGAAGWQPVTPELRVTGRFQPLASGQLLITAYDGIRAGLAAIDPDKRVWRWALTDPAVSFLPVAVHPEGQVAALRRPADGTPTLISFEGETTRQVLALPELGVPPARVLSWDGPACRLEGLFVSPPAPGPWPLVVDLHGGPNHTLVAGYAHELDRWRRAGMAALAPEYAAAGIGGSERRATAWGHPGACRAGPQRAGRGLSDRSCPGHRSGERRRPVRLVLGRGAGQPPGHHRHPISGCGVLGGRR